MALCGASKRSNGEPCKRHAVPGSSRCKLHGGKSTGPKDPARPMGNSRATKHGLYSKFLTEEEQADFNAAELDQIDDELRLTKVLLGRVLLAAGDGHDLGMAVKTDPHDYFTIEGREATAVELIDFHLKFLDEFADHPALVMIGLQNEPKGTSGRWNVVADQLVKEIRTVTDKIINVPGDSYQSVTRWMRENPLYPLDYPNLVYGGHLYMDHDASGTWNRGRTAHVDPMQGVRMLEGWIKNFLEPNDCYGHIGEIGVPWENESALLALDNFLAFAKSQPRILGVTYWADGPWWGVNKEGIPPVNAIRSNGKWHEPTLNVVQKYVKR